jgi:transglutaminase-like putative cysteine protease
MIVPKPPDLPAQAIRNARTSPEGNVIQDLSPRHQPLFRARIQAGNESLQHEIAFQLLFDADLFSRRLVLAGNRDPAARPAASLPEDERRLSLRPTRQIDYANKAIENWAAKVGLKDRAAEEGEIDYAHRVFQAIVATCQYEYRNEQDRAASHVAMAGRSDCGGLCNLFVALLRAHGIPARTLAGRWAFSARPGQRMGEVDYFQEHIKAEFFAQGVGWIPIDLSSATLYEGPSEKSRYFGNDPGTFVTIHLDSELTFDTIYFGSKTMNLLQKASYWVTGLGSLAGVVISENWLVR